MRGSQGRSSGWEQEARTEADTMESRGLLACSVCLLGLARTNCPGIAPPTVIWAGSRQSLIREGALQVCLQVIWRRRSLLCVPLPRCMKVCVKLKPTSSMLNHSLLSEAPGSPKGVVFPFASDSSFAYKSDSGMPIPEAGVCEP